MSYVEIVVNSPLSRRRSGLTPTFHYHLPPHLESHIAVGQLVRVPFGPRTLQGLVVARSERSPVVETREVEGIIDPRPVLFEWQIELARWISREYLTTLRDALLLVLPPGLGQRSRTLVEAIPDPPSADSLTPQEHALLENIRRSGAVRLDLLRRRLKSPEAAALVERLLRKGFLRTRSQLEPPRVRPKTEPVAELRVEMSEELLDRLARAPQQAAILEYLAEHDGVASAAQLHAELNASQDALRALARKGLIEFRQEQVWRDPLAERTFRPVPAPRLTSEQEAAYREILEALSASGGHGACFLLHGVTGSGKTEIYLRVLSETLKVGKQGIVLVPEISLTPQTVRRFAERFPGRIAVLHSRLSDGERYDTWRRARDGLVDVVIGPRSALFAPLPKIGLIVVDEEHDGGYKQDAPVQPPYYHARDVAVKLGQLLGATVILGSATPDIATYYGAERGEFVRLSLPQRIMGHRRELEEQRDRLGVPPPRSAVRELGVEYEEARYLELPPVQVVDLRQELRAGNTSIFSRAMSRAIEQTLSAEEQVILFLNRRGAATFVLCRDCGHVLICPRCRTSYTYHSAEEDLVCHHCNRRAPLPAMCPQCGSARIKYFGLGTQRVEEEVRKLFPLAHTLRWDRDTTGGKGSHERILEGFIQRQANVLIGTQMVAKGLDLPLVTLVGVISADTVLHLPDYRAGERTFQLLTQVAGRAGRSILGGKVIVQTYAPQHYAIQAASRHDYGEFYRQEMAFRREQGYPPFTRLIRLIYVSTSPRRAQQEAEAMRRRLEQKMAERGYSDVELIGPAPAFYARLRGKYRWHLVVKGLDEKGQQAHALLADEPLPLGWRVDVDPVSLL